MNSSTYFVMKLIELCSNEFAMGNVMIVVVVHGLKLLYAQECIQTKVVEESGLSNLVSVESIYDFLVLCNSD
jgi:hypothetical protein